MGFGDFMKGMQSGMSTMDELKNSSQRRKVFDRAITEDDINFDAMDYDRARLGLPQVKRSSSSRTFLDMAQEKLDPVISRWMEKLGRGTGTTESPIAAALPTSEEVTYKPQQSIEDVTAGLQPEMPQYAGGGQVKPEDELGGWADDKTAGKPKADKYSPDSPSEVKARAAQSRAGSQAIPDSVEGDPSKYRSVKEGQVGNAARKGAIPEAAPAAAETEKGLMRRAAGGAGKAARVAGKAFVLGEIAGAGAGGVRGALNGGDTYTDPLGRGDPLIDTLYDVGGRTVGAVKGAVAGAFNPVDAVTGLASDALDAAGLPVPGSKPAAAAEAVPTADPRRASGPTSRNGPARVQRAPAAGPAVPTTPAEASPLAGFDVTKVKAADIPNFSNKDWEQFRDEQIKSLVMHGMSYAEAWDKVDQQVVATQQRGFMRFGNQARELLAMGDLNGAASAVRAAFQYFPSTTDLQVGQYNGHLVAFSVDEDTGQQVGTPLVLTPETLDSVLSNFSDRNAWVEHAQDRRKLDQADRELDQGDKKLDIMSRANEIDAFKANTDAIRYGGGEGGGLKPADVDRAAQQSFLDAAAGVSDDPAVQRAVVAAMARLYREGGGRVDAQTIADRVARYAQTEEGLKEILDSSVSAMGN